MNLQLKTVYAKPSENDGIRLWTEALWPNEVDTRNMHLDRWIKELAPSFDITELYRRGEIDRQGFKEAYWDELAQKDKQTQIQYIKNKQEEHTITLLYSSKNEQNSIASYLKEFLEK